MHLDLLALLGGPPCVCLGLCVLQVCLWVHMGALVSHKVLARLKPHQDIIILCSEYFLFNTLFLSSGILAF